MRAMILEAQRQPLKLVDIPEPVPGDGQILIKVNACGVCRTDLHIVDGDLKEPKLPLVLGHQIAGTVAALGPGVEGFDVGDRVGVPWLGWTDGDCRYCRSGRENLCDNARFTGYDSDGGFAEFAVADHRYCFPIPEGFDDLQAAPLLCAGLIGYRSLRMTGEAERLGLYGFGASAHIVCQLAKFLGRRVFAFSKPGDEEGQAFARELGADWAGGSDERPPGAARRRDRLRAGRPADDRGAQGVGQGRPHSQRRHPHVRHSLLPLRRAVGRALADVGREPHPRGRARVPRAGAAGALFTPR